MPFEGFTLKSENFEGLKDIGDQIKMFTEEVTSLLSQLKMGCNHTIVYAACLRKESWGRRVSYFEVASFEHSDLKWSFNIVAMIVLTLKCQSEADLSGLEHSLEISTCLII